MPTLTYEALRLVPVSEFTLSKPTID